MDPVKVVNILWDRASDLVVPPQLAIVIVSDKDGICAFRHNCVSGEKALASALREFANKLDNKETEIFQEHAQANN
jgi:hypothetical protein